MELTEVDRKILTWLRALGSEPDYTYQTNVRSYDQAARKAAEVLSLPADMIRDRLLAFEQEGLVEIVPRPGYSLIYFARITEDGKQELRQAARHVQEGAPTIFVSCGQTTDEERQLGASIAEIINKETPATAYYAENQATFEGVSSHILDSLSRCIGFVGIMHGRGTVTEPDHTTYERASVWIEQELAIAAYRIHTLKQAIPVQLYIQSGINREGLRDKIMLNPTKFDTSAEVLEHFQSIVRERFGNLQNEREATTQVSTAAPAAKLFVGSHYRDSDVHHLTTANEAGKGMVHQSLFVYNEGEKVVRDATLLLWVPMEFDPIENFDRKHPDQRFDVHGFRYVANVPYEGEKRYWHMTYDIPFPIYPKAPPRLLLRFPLWIRVPTTDYILWRIYYDDGVTPPEAEPAGRLGVTTMLKR